MSKFSFARAALLGVVSTAPRRCTAQASSTCAVVFPTRAAIAEMTGSSSNPSADQKIQSWLHLRAALRPASLAEFKTSMLLDYLKFPQADLDTAELT